jgi:hypothetical protein
MFRLGANGDIDSWVRKYIELCPGKPPSLQSIVFGPKILSYRDPAFWGAYSRTPARELERYLEIAARGKPLQRGTLGHR